MYFISLFEVYQKQILALKMLLYSFNSIVIRNISIRRIIKTALPWLDTLGADLFSNCKCDY